MIDPHTQTVLEDILRRESRSVLRYVAEAFPWINSTEEKSLATLQQVLAAEREAVIGLGQFLLRNRGMLPFLPSYPASFTTINFLALDYVVPLLVERERRSIAELERDLASVKGPAARAEVEKLLAVKKRHLPELEVLIPSRTQASLT